jgi:hypothetical protein
MTKEEEAELEKEQTLDMHLVLLFDIEALLLLRPFHLSLYRRIPYNEIKNYFVTKVLTDRQKLDNWRSSLFKLL